MVIGLVGCSKPVPTVTETPATPPPQKTMTIGTNVYRLFRPEGEPNEYGARFIELWSKDGVPTNEFVYMRTVFANGDSHFTRIQP